MTGTWTASGREASVTLPEGGRAVTYTGVYADAIGQTHAVMRLAADGATPRTRSLAYAGGAAKGEGWAFSREFQHYWAQLVPETGEPDTVQGEVLRATIDLSGMYGNSGGGNWMERPDEYESLADRGIAALCDGTLGEGEAEFVHRVVTGLRIYCRGEGRPARKPDCADVDRLPNLALEWCKRHPLPFPRPPTR